MTEIALVDSHCHLDFTVFDQDRAAVLARARQAGVRRILIPGIDLETSRNALALAEHFPEVYAAVGVHPNDANGWNDQALAELHRLAQHPKTVAIGEIGLDYYRMRAAPDLQKKILHLQLTVATEYNKPVILHLRNHQEHRQAAVDLLEILRDWWYMLVGRQKKLRQAPGVLHSFSDTEETARLALEMNFSIGITGPVTFHKAQETHRLVERLPLESLLVETDAPFLTPVPHRGQRNEPGYVRLVAEKIAELKKLSLAVVARITTDNAMRLFAW